ncbi:energy transducer TonB [Hahella ganghwensis]|uniref:energy transducer TonB n=1 Tax=Hahella ganghwensis TaxID=286420 RepID=UPI000379609A|nr:energy transducer TonB [Hahella ganghwensis]
MAIEEGYPEELSRGASKVSAGDRLGFTIFMALALHATIVFGVSFAIEERQPAPRTVEVTLAQYDDQEEPEDADFVAQTNQKGSGTLEEKSELTTIEKADFRDTEARKVAQVEPDTVATKKERQAKDVVVTTDQSPKDVAPTGKTEKETPAEEKPQKRSLLQRSIEIASLEAKLAEQQNAYAKRPRVTRLTAVSARQSSSAFYMDNWRRKVERVGNLNYPDEARRRELHGQVRVAVKIQPDGRVLEISILESSGYKILDDAVVRIIRLAEPFAPFTEAMRKEADIFEIIRTFDFDRRISSY